jgi:hypothetical protein
LLVWQQPKVQMLGIGRNDDPALQTAIRYFQLCFAL